MNIFLILSGLPYDRGEAIEVVSHEIVRLMAAAGHKLTIQVIIRENRSEKIEKLFYYVSRSFENNKEIKLLPIIYLAELLTKCNRRKKIIEYGCAVIKSLPGLRNFINPYFFPAIAAKELIRDHVAQTNPDIILSIWSWEALAASYDIRGIPKFVYYGNPNHKPPEAQMKYPELFEIEKQGLLNQIRFKTFKLFNRAREIQHLKMMAQCEVTANNSIVDSEYYRNEGHPKSIYLQNIWPEDPRGPVYGGRLDMHGPVKIVGSVGNLGATGNTFGLNYLGRCLAPILEEKFGESNLLIKVYGKGKPRTKVAEALKRNTIQLCGWVDDLIEEIHQSYCFLVLTNVDGFIVGNTRILLAWSLGACVVAHTNSALSMPEIKHRENVLLGNTPEEIADHIENAYRDPKLRSKIGKGGYETFLEYYKSDSVVPKMMMEMEECITDFKRRNN